ncbi:patatin-like phospholipase family protein (plasmid) [Rhizobium sp. 32-5/1]|uniref:patatin-like phospholipase family protein n=1 Tax=Rhizobium sp. 32-5/1 TaxID=3019602 RepID=UPI00240D94F6|nr:patatin-like phospholipase family protein [Rhizobium sp. 32-5/1]WEZ85490.1 patatin-like phospholipase family protein [Rhizobium sp. 32-5/1]
MLAARWSRLNFSGGVARNLEEEVGEPLRRFCRKSVDVAATGWGSILPGKSIGDVLANIYDDDLYDGVTLQDLPEKPQFVFNATNLQTGRLVRLQKVRLADYSIGEILNPRIKLAVAVAASSAFPPVLSPVQVDVDFNAWQDREGTSHFGNPDYGRSLSLTDGGAYDNLGLETVDDFANVVVCDAGAPFSMEPEAASLWPKQAMRALDIATDQSRGLRKRLLHTEMKVSGRKYAYAAIDGNPAEFDAPRTLQTESAKTRPLASIRTRLNPFSDEEQGKLINWGWYMTDIAVRSHLAKTASAPTDWPEPRFALD